MEGVRAASRILFAMAVAGLSWRLGSGCAGARTRESTLLDTRFGQVKEASSTARPWRFVPESRERFCSPAILLPDSRGELAERTDEWAGGSWTWSPWQGFTEPRGPYYPSAALILDHWTEAERARRGWSPAAVPPEDAKEEPSPGETPGEEHGRGSPIGLYPRVHPLEAPGEEPWRTLDLRRPTIIGKRVGGERGERVVLEVEVLDGERIGSVALLGADSLLEKGGRGEAVVRLPFSEVGSVPVYGRYARVFVDVEDQPIPAGVYLLVVVTKSGVPSAGQLVVVDEVPPGEGK